MGDYHVHNSDASWPDGLVACCRCDTALVKTTERNCVWRSDDGREADYACAHCRDGSEEEEFAAIDAPAPKQGGLF
jgi:hypothetical protein